MTINSAVTMGYVSPPIMSVTISMTVGTTVMKKTALHQKYVCRFIVYY